MIQQNANFLNNDNEDISHITRADVATNSNLDFPATNRPDESMEYVNYNNMNVSVTQCKLKRSRFVNERFVQAEDKVGGGKYVRQSVVQGIGAKPGIA